MAAHDSVPFPPEPDPFSELKDPAPVVDPDLETAPRAVSPPRPAPGPQRAAVDMEGAAPALEDDLPSETDTAPVSRPLQNGAIDPNTLSIEELQRLRLELLRAADEADSDAAEARHQCNIYYNSARDMRNRVLRSPAAARALKPPEGDPELLAQHTLNEELRVLSEKNLRLAEEKNDHARRQAARARQLQSRAREIARKIAGRRRQNLD